MPKNLASLSFIQFYLPHTWPQKQLTQSDWEVSRSCWRNEKWVLATHYILCFNCSLIRKFFPADMLRKEHLPQFASLRAELKILMITVLKILLNWFYWIFLGNFNGYSDAWARSTIWKIKITVIVDVRTKAKKQTKKFCKKSNTFTHCSNKYTFFKYTIITYKDALAKSHIQQEKMSITEHNID